MCVYLDDVIQLNIVNNYIYVSDVNLNIPMY